MRSSLVLALVALCLGLAQAFTALPALVQPTPALTCNSRHRTASGRDSSGFLAEKRRRRGCEGRHDSRGIAQGQAAFLGRGSFWVVSFTRANVSGRGLRRERRGRGCLWQLVNSQGAWAAGSAGSVPWLAGARTWMCKRR